MHTPRGTGPASTPLHVVAKLLCAGLVCLIALAACPENTPVKPDPEPATGDFVATYDADAGGNQVFVVDTAPGTAFEFALDLRGVTQNVEVYLISTNTSEEWVDAPDIELETPTDAASMFDGDRSRVAATDAFLVPHDRHDITAFNNAPLRPSRREALPQRSMSSLQPTANSVGDTHTFLDVPNDIPATVRKIVTDSAVPLTAVVWVADASWGTGCSLSFCVTQQMVDAVASKFLQEGGNNDVYDWVTGVFGVPWGPHEYPGALIDSATAQIDILLYDIHGDNSTTGGTLGFFWAKDLYVPGGPGVPAGLPFSISNQKLMFYLDSVLLAAPDDGAAWDITHFWPSRMMQTLAHEFQHLIHYYQKLVVTDSDPVSEAWLNEMSSEVAADLVADKLEVHGPRGVAHGDGTAGAPGNGRGRLPRYNFYNDIQVTAWDSLLENYSINYALGAYLARTYGADVFTRIVQNDQSGTEAIEAAVGGGTTFGQILRNWAVANVLSDDPSASDPYRYNTGTWRTSTAGGVTYALGSINLYNYEIVRLEGPFFHSLGQLERRKDQAPHSNLYVALGSHRGLLEGTMDYAPDTQITIVVKE